MLTLSPPLGLQHAVLPALYCLALNAPLAPVHCGYPRLQSSTAQWVWNGAGSLESVWKSACVCVCVRDYTDSPLQLHEDDAT